MADIFEANGLVGDAVNPYQQTYADTCAIKSQQIILNEFGIPATEDQLVQYSYEKGWYHGDGSGTTMQDVGNLLEDANIPCTRQANANVFNLVSELSQGHKVIVGVDSGELWGNKFSTWYNDFFNGDTPDHALIVSGIDTSDPNNVQVIVTDPGNGDYHKAYPLDQFMDAWSDASCYMVSTDIAVPDVVNGMQNFNYDAGHIDSVAGMDYTDFQIFNDLSYGLPVYGLNGMGTYDFPVSSLMDAYWGVANNDIMFGDIFSGYAFNDYLDVDIATQMMHNTYDMGFNQIDFNSFCMANPEMCPMIGPDMNFIDPISNTDYNDFLSGSIDYFNSIGDYNSAAYCQQQQMMLDFCDTHDIDFYSAFMS